MDMALRLNIDAAKNLPLGGVVTGSEKHQVNKDCMTVDMEMMPPDPRWWLVMIGSRRSFPKLNLSPSLFPSNMFDNQHRKLPKITI